MEEGAIGKLTVVQANAFELFDRQPGEQRRWIIEREHSGGGPMMDFGLHRAELFHQFFGPVESTTAAMDRALFERDVEDTSVALFKLNGGARGVLTVTRAAAEAQDTLSLFSSAGSLHIPVLNQGKLHIRNAKGESVDRLPSRENFHRPLVEYFLQSSRAHREPPGRPRGAENHGADLSRMNRLLRQLRSLAARRLTEHQQVAQESEDLAYDLIRESGYRVIERNYRRLRGKGEVGLLAWDGDMLACVEVKTRRTADYGRPERDVDAKKRGHLIRTAYDYARRANIEPQRLRFNVVAVVLNEGPDLRLFKDAFSKRSQERWFQR